MKEIDELLNKYKDNEYALFSCKLAPGFNEDYFMGVRMGDVRKIAKDIKGSDIEISFLNELPHKTYDENMLHSVILCNITNYDRAIKEITKFLPYVNNWATCDTMHPKGFSKNKEDLLNHIKKWLKSKETYTVRFAIDCLMTFYLDESFSESHFDLLKDINTDEYYINMSYAWYIATALAKKYEPTIKLLESKTLPKWVQNKSIQKAKESYRISKETKEYIETLKK